MLDDKQNKSKNVLKGGLLALALLSAGVASAHDLGVQGKVWEITEIDVRQLVMASAAEADFNKVNKDREYSAKTFMDNLPKRTMGVTETTETRWIDPSVELASDIMAAGENSVTKNLEWSPLAKKGVRVNPLTVYHPVTAMLFFDGTSESQVEFVKEVLREDRYGRVTLVEASGANLTKLTKSIGRPVFYANEQMIQRFSITIAPSLLYAGSGDHEGFLGLTMFASPFQISALKAAWDMDITKSRGPLTGVSNAAHP